MSEGLYIDIWKTAESLIVDAIKKGESASYDLNPEVFLNAGNREKYSFRTTFSNGRCTNYANSAVARDLVEVLESSHAFRNACKDKNVVIRMGKAFDLQIIL